MYERSRFALGPLLSLWRLNFIHYGKDLWGL
jgi:hypothetical protein